MTGKLWQHKRMQIHPPDPLSIDVRALNRRLARAAGTFDDASALHREVADRLLERLSFIKLQPRRVLDLGCGPGLATPGLRRLYPKTQVIVADQVPEFVLQARHSASRWRRLPGLVSGLTQLPLATSSVDLIFSSLVLHRVSDLARAVREFQRVLTPGGVLMFATFGPDTLKELRQAWAAVDSGGHVQGFVDMHDIGDALVGGRLADPVMDLDHFTLTYAALNGLVADLGALGLRNVLADRAKGLTPPRLWQAVQQQYQQLADETGRIPATWEVAYGHAWGTEGQAQIKGETGEVRVPIQAGAIPRRGD